MKNICILGILEGGKGKKCISVNNGWKIPNAWERTRHLDPKKSKGCQIDWTQIGYNMTYYNYIVKRQKEFLKQQEKREKLHTREPP